MGRHSSYTEPHIVLLPMVAASTKLAETLTAHLPEDLRGTTVELVGANNSAYAEAAVAAVMANLLNKRKAKDVYLHGGGPKLEKLVSDLKEKYYQ